MVTTTNTITEKVPTRIALVRILISRTHRSSRCEKQRSSSTRAPMRIARCRSHYGCIADDRQTVRAIVLSSSRACHRSTFRSSRWIRADAPECDPRVGHPRFTGRARISRSRL